MAEPKTSMVQIAEKDRYDFEISIKPIGIRSRIFIQAMFFSLFWFGFLSIVTVFALQDFQDDNYILVFFWLAGLFHLGNSLSKAFTKHIIVFTRESIRFVKSTPFSTKELQIELIEVEKIHGDQALKKPFRYKKSLDKPEKIRRGIIVNYGFGSTYELGEYLSRQDQLSISRLLNERIEERQKFLR